MRISCTRCDGKIEFEYPPKVNVVCPFCQAFLISVDPRTGATWRRGRPWRSWLRVAGWVALAAGLLGFSVDLVKADMKSGAHRETTLLAGLSSPLFFVGLPAGILALIAAGASATAEHPAPGVHRAPD